jgi:hypothetical protein
MKVPVITTEGAPWGGLLTHQCGWWTPVGLSGIRSALSEALLLPAAALAAMGQRGKAWVDSEFTWDKVTRDMFSVYRWATGSDSRPQCVTLGH